MPLLVLCWSGKEGVEEKGRLASRGGSAHRGLGVRPLRGGPQSLRRHRGPHQAPAGFGTSQSVTSNPGPSKQGQDLILSFWRRQLIKIKNGPPLFPLEIHCASAGTSLEVNNSH